MVVATDSSEKDGNVLATAPAEKREAVLEEDRKRHTGGKSFVVESERTARDPVGTDNALFPIHSEKQRRRGVVGRQGGDDPFMAEVLAEEALFDRAGGSDGGGESELLRPVRAVCRDGGDVENASEFARSVEDRGAGTSEFAVARTIVLTAVDEQGTLFGNAGANAVSAFDLLGPDAAEPDAPTLEIVGVGFVAAMVNRHSGVIAQENDVSLLPNDGVETIDFFSCLRDDVGYRFF